MTPIAAPAPVSSTMLTRVAVGISIAVHVAAVLLSLGYAGAGLFEASDVEPVAVSLVTPDEVATPEPPPVEQKPEPDTSQLDLRLSPIESPKQQPQPQPQPQKAEQSSPQTKPAPQPPNQQQAAAAAPQPAQATQQPQQQLAQPAFTQPQPDISMRYQVDLGLKMLAAAPSPTVSAQDGASDFDAPAMTKADIAGASVAAFRAKLKQCAPLPAQISPDDRVVIVLRATFTPDAKLATAPVLIEASASAKGPALMQAAIGALQSCQPHNALSADSYAEWRVLDLRFTPRDFRPG